MKIFTVNGFPRSGKDTFIRFLIKRYPKCFHTSMIHSIKDYLFASGVWHGQKTEKDRNMLSEIKDVLDKYNDFSYNEIRQEIVKYQELCGTDVFFIDAREPKDLQRFKDEYEAKSIFIKRDAHKTASNHADQNVLNFDYDFIIENNGTLEDLELAAEKFYKENIE